jgi:hypothetical protein
MIIKSFTYVIVLGSVVFVLHKPLSATIGCMDDSQYGYTERGYDYKTLHYVSCSCPCSSYKNLNQHGRCLQCGHYHKPQEMEIVMSGNGIFEQ